MRLNTTPSTSASIAATGVEGNDERKTDSSPSTESTGVTSVTYDPPPASWFFSRGGRNETKPKDSAKNSTQDTSSYFTGKPKAASTLETQDRTNSAHVHFSPNDNMSMVSDNDEEDEHEGFNFIAISNSLLMAGRSFEHVSQSSNQDTDEHSGSSSDRQQGVLIVDGIASDGSVNNADNSVLTIPGSDSLPSEIGTICEEEEDQTDPLFGHPTGPEALGQDPQGEALGTTGSYYHQPLVHRFWKNLQKTRRLRKVSDASDVDAGLPSSDVSVVRNNDDDSATVDLVGWDRLKIYLRKPHFLFLLFAFVANLSFASHRNQRMAWELRLQQEQEATQDILLEKEKLRQEVEALMEDLAVASARADSLARDQERLILEREEAQKAEKERLRLLEEQEKRKQRERRNQKRRRQQPWRSDGEDFGWFFDDSNEDCGAHSEGASSAFTIADNCWIKAKADINLGNCGGETKDYLYDFWNGLWEDWDYYFYEPTDVESFSNAESCGSKKPSMESDNGYFQIGSGDDNEGDFDEGSNYQYQDDTYYPEQDPLQDLVSVIQAAGQSVVNTLSSLLSDEADITQKAVHDMEDVAREKYEEASDTVAGAIETAKEDIRELSKEALSALRTAVQKSTPEGAADAGLSAKAQEVTRKGLYDAAVAVTALSSSWQQYAKSLSVVGKGNTEQ